MDRITRQDIDELLDEHDSPCVSIYMQTHPTGAEGESDPLRLKTLANEVEKTLLKSARRSVTVRDFLEPIRQLPVDEMFWKDRSTGLAVFRSQDLFRAFRVAIELTPAIHIQERFIIRPLLPLAIESDEFFLLTLSQHRVRLFSGSRYGLTLMQVPEMPTRMATLIATDQGRKQMHIGGNDPSRKHSTIYHGHGGKPDARKDEIEEFLREIDVAVHPILKRSRAPLILGGVAALIAQYRRISEYAPIASQNVEENCDRLSESRLYHRAWPCAREAIVEEQRRQIAHEYDHADSSRCVQDVQRIIPAAVAGHVGVLLIASDASLPGAFDQASNTVNVGRDLDDDLADLAATNALRHRGKVFIVDRDEMPEHSDIAAILRQH